MAATPGAPREDTRPPRDNAGLPEVRPTPPPARPAGVVVHPIDSSSTIVVAVVLPPALTYVVFLQQRPLLALSSKSLSPSCASDLGDIATFFFRKNISIRYQNMGYNDVLFGEL